MFGFKNKMFEELKNKRVLVTGPQRSGTTICSRIISHDANLEYIDEDQVGVDSLILVNDLFETRKNFVLQAPAISRLCHLIRADVVVFMIRNIKDIIASQERVNWQCEAIELKKYNKTEGVIAEEKYKFWYYFQKQHIINYLEVKYESLEKHKLFIKDRKNFKIRQWKKE